MLRRSAALSDHVDGHGKDQCTQGYRPPTDHRRTDNDASECEESVGSRATITPLKVIHSLGQGRLVILFAPGTPLLFARLVELARGRIATVTLVRCKLLTSADRAALCAMNASLASHHQVSLAECPTTASTHGVHAGLTIVARLFVWTGNAKHAAGVF